LKLKSEKKSFQDNKIDDVIAYTRAASYTLKVSSGSEAVQLFTRSKRIQTDLSFAELMGGDKFDLQVVIREWCPQILPEWEFRIFIWNYKLACCSQYYSDCFVPEIYNNKHKIANLITKFYEEEVKHLIPAHVPNLTFDVALTPDLDKVYMIELGNPPPVAGTALYDWNNEHDRKMMTAEFPFELRLLDALPDGKWESLHRSVKQIICKERGLRMAAFGNASGPPPLVHSYSSRVFFGLAFVVVLVGIGAYIYKKYPFE